MSRLLPPVHRHLLLFAIPFLLSGALLAPPLPPKTEFPTGAYVSGDFTVAFGADGSFSVSEKSDLVVEGAYTVVADRISFIDTQGRYACTAEGEGKYNWKQNGETLSFTKIADDCPGRTKILTMQPLTRQKKQ